MPKIENVHTACDRSPRPKGLQSWQIIWGLQPSQYIHAQCLMDMRIAYCVTTDSTVEPACKVHVLSKENWPYKRSDLISGL